MKTSDLQPFTDAIRDAFAAANGEAQRLAASERDVRQAEHRARLAELDTGIARVVDIERRLAERLASLKDGEQGPAGADGAPGERGERGPDGPAGKVQAAAPWTEGVHYMGDIVTHEGATYQASKDTAAAPPSAEWVCLSARGADGQDGRSFTVRGTWSEAETYDALDVVVLNGASFAARRKTPGACPGDGWQMIASQGKRGVQGERGPNGERGPAGPPVAAIDVGEDGMLTITNGDGSVVTCDLYPLLARIK